MSLIRLDKAPLTMFSSASDSAARITHLAWFLIVLAAIVYAIVIVFMLVAMRRNRARDPDGVDLSDPGTKWIAIGGGALPAIVLLAVFVVSETAMGSMHSERPAVTINVIAHQWWWEVKYALPELSDHFSTANEIHIPVGREVRLILMSADVIHSFWVPQLQGKLDIIPGDTNDLRLVARTPGTYLGTCAEFCGPQHTHMRMAVVAEDSAAFAQWLRHQIDPAKPPTDETGVVGERLFVGGPCAMCHTVRGTPAQGGVAPDLTHVGSRLTIAAGTLPNTLGNLEAWIANAQALKPGAQMPPITGYSGEQLRALAEYVSSLK